MSWEDIKKKKEQKSNTNINSFSDSKNNNIQMTSWQRIKKKKEEQENTISSSMKNKNSSEEKDNTWFKSSKLFDDGYQFGDISGTVAGTVGDIGVGLGRGAFNLVEGAVNLGIYGVADAVGMFGNESKANEIRELAKVNATDKIFNPVEEFVDKSSVLGDKSDSVVEGLGYVAGITAVSMVSGGIGGALGASTATSATIGTTATTFASAMGNGMSEALKDGATLDEARIYGAISGAGEAVSELAFGGLGKASQAMGLSKGALDDVLIGGLTKNIKNKMVKTVVQSGLKATGEGLEEIVSGLISAAGKKLTYMDNKKYSEILKDENLAEQFWMGTLTSAISQGPSTIRSIRTGTDYITGRTNNEQKVYDNEVKTRTDNKIKQATIEQAYNTQIKAQENLGIEITEDLKSQIMQKIEKAYNNGTLKTTELSKKDIMKIQDEVETDMQDGNISLENIRNVLGENQDISNDSLLMKSKYENEQKYNSYKVEQTANEKVNVLMQSATDAGMNNTSKTRKKVELISKLVKDTNRQYKFVSPEQLKQMGYNENANGLINKSTGEILINAHTEKGIETIVGHETTHIFDSKDKEGNYTKEYQILQDMAIEYAKVKGIYDSKVQSITSAYGNLLADESQIKEELTADLVGDFLFSDEKFIENLAVKDRNVFQKIYDYIKHIYKVATAGTDEAKVLENLKYQFDRVYKTVSMETNTDTKYSVGGIKALKNIKDSQIKKEAYNSYKKAKQMAKNKESNEKIFKETGWYKDKVTGKMKFNFSDKDMRIVNRNYKVGQEFNLEDILVHKTLFEIYPQLSTYKVKIEDMNKNKTNANGKLNGRYNRYTNEITIDINRFKNISNADGTLIHEIQHAIQKIEGFAGGTSIKFGKEKYKKNPGEREARDTATRMIQEKYNNKDLSNIMPKSANIDTTILEKMKIGLYNYLSSINNEGEYNEAAEIHQKENTSTASENNELVLGRVINKNNKVIEESENNSGSFYFDKNAKRYEDLLSSNTINYDKRSNGLLNIEMFNDDELINQITVGSKEEIVKQLGKDLGNYIYENVNEDSQTLDLTKQEIEKDKPITHKEKQLEIIKKTNPMLDDYHTGIRNVEDIKSFEEVITDDESFAWGDFSKEDAENALKKGRVTVYSSYPIKQGTFISTSKIQAEEYAGGRGNKVYSKTISLDEVAWINGDEGQYANINQKYSLTNDTGITGDDIAVKDMLVQQRPTIENEVGNTQKTILEENVEKNEQENVNDQKSSFKELQDKYKLMEIGKRQYEKLLRKEKPTEKEKITVDRLIKGEIENNEIPASVNRQRVVDLYNAKVKFYSVEQEIKAQRKAITKSYRDLAKNMIKNISTWKDKKMGIQYQVNTMKRNLRDIIPDKSEADSLYNEYFKPITKNNATIEKEISKYNDRISKYEINNVESQYIQMIGENKYNPDTKLPLEKIEEFYDKHKSKIDINKCQEAVEEFRNIYDELIVKINDVLIENGYKPIEYRKGYFPHFVENKASTILGKFAEKLGWKINADTLPTDIAGITDQFKPGKAWTAFSQQRKGDETDYNALKGFDNYIRGAMDVIHHTKDIQKLRALENEIRYQYSEKGIQEQIDNIYDDHESSIEEKQEKINEIFENNKNNPMGFLATELRDYTNNLANKKATADRGLEHSAGRQTYSIMTNIQNRVSANMVGANISSAMTNFIPITQAWSQTSTKNMMRAIKEGIAIQFKDDGFSNESTFLTNRTKQADRLYKTGLDKANDKLGYMFDVVDSFTSNVIVRAKYYDNIDTGMSTYDALENADEFAKDVIAGRSKGDMPTIFNQKNPLTKLFTAFQLEVNNQYGYMLKDLPIDLGDEAKEKLVGAFVKMFLGAFLYNMISEKITGNKSAFSPIDIALDSYNTLTNDETSSGDKIKSIGTDLASEAPFIGGMLGGGRLSIQGAIPYENPASMIIDTISNTVDLFDQSSEERQKTIKSLVKEWSKPLYYVALPFAGGQLKKSLEGISMYLNDIPGSYTNNGDLRFTVDDDISSKIKASIFGTYSNPYAQDYIDSGFKIISKDNIDEMVGLDMNSSEYRQFKSNLTKVSNTSDKNGYKQYVDDNNNVYWYDSNTETMYDSNYKKTALTEDDLTKVSKTEESLNYIDSLDLTDTQKNIAANNLNKNSKKTIDMSVYGDYSSYDEYKYARDYPEKYSVVSQITDYDSYVKYKDDIADIKKKYSTEAGYKSQERRTAVHDYINNLNLNVGQKLMLEKMAGGYSIKNYQNYIYEYLEQTDLTSSEKYAIWEELFD